MEQVLGLIFLAAYIAGVVGLAAGVTYVVVKLFPTRDRDKAKPEDGSKKQAAANDSPGGGRLFRKSKKTA